MTLKDLLAKKKEKILQRCLDRVLEVYPPDTQRVFRENKSAYSNPIGFTLRKGMERLIGEILQPTSAAEARAILEPIMKVRAVESIPPSTAVSFIFSLKKVFTELRGEKDFGQEWLDLNSRINLMALQAFDLYMESREKISQLKIGESKKSLGKTDDGGRAI